MTVAGAGGPRASVGVVAWAGSSTLRAPATPTGGGRSRYIKPSWNVIWMCRLSRTPGRAAGAAEGTNEVSHPGAGRGVGTAGRGCLGVGVAFGLGTGAGVGLGVGVGVRVGVGVGVGFRGFAVPEEVRRPVSGGAAVFAL